MQSSKMNIHEFSQSPISFNLIISIIAGLEVRAGVSSVLHREATSNNRDMHGNKISKDSCVATKKLS